MILSDWSFLVPFLSKSVIVAIAIGILGILVGKFGCYTEPEDFQ